MTITESFVCSVDHVFICVFIYLGDYYGEFRVLCGLCIYMCVYIF